MKVLVTGAAGFIGYHLCDTLLRRGDSVIGIDTFSPYYDVGLKEARVARLKGDFHLLRGNIADHVFMNGVFDSGYDVVVNLAAQAGVRYSLQNPMAYVESNVAGFVNVLEGLRKWPCPLVFASTSSVYGLNTSLPFSEDQNTDHPVSLYAATKKANEAMAHSYSHLFGIPATGLRFFTVYGPWGRPDMALFKFTKGILADEPIPVFNEGQMIRDFTYVDDIVEGVVRVIDRPAQSDPKWSGASPRPSTSSAPWKIYNIGNNNPVKLMSYIRALEDALGKKAKLQLLPMQQGDVAATEADTSSLECDTGFRPQTSVEEGIRRFVAWYREYYRA